MWGCSFSSLDSVYVNIFFRICIVFIEKDPVGDIFKLNCSQFACLCFDAYKCQPKMCKAIQLYYAYMNRFFSYIISSILCRIYFTHRFYTYLYDYWNKVQLKYELVCKSSKSNSIIMQIIRFFSLTPFGSVRFFLCQNAFWMLWSTIFPNKILDAFFVHHVENTYPSVWCLFVT